jgi:hypothetical protein
MTKPDKCPKCGARVLEVTYSLLNKNHVDEPSEYVCLLARGQDAPCNWRVGRFCGERLYDNQAEPPFCTGKEHHK